MKDISTFQRFFFTLFFWGLYCYSFAQIIDIDYGQYLDGIVSNPSSTVSFNTPMAQEGDVLLVRVSSIGLKLRLELFSPSGELIQPVVDGAFNKPLTLIHKVETGEAGIYKIIISNTGIWDGNFCISLNRMNNSPVSEFLNCNTSLENTLDCRGDVRAFRFFVSEGSISRITLAEPVFAPEVWLTDFHGNILRHETKGFSQTLILDAIEADTTACFNVFVTDSEGFWDNDFSISHTLIFGECAAPVIGLSPTSGTICEGEDITMEVITSFSEAQYLWTGPNSFTSTDSIVNFLNASPAISGTYTVRVTAPDMCESVISETITVNHLPTATASITVDTVCAGESFEFDVATNASLYEWNGPDGYSSAKRSPTITTSDTSSTELRIYTVTVTNSVTGCTNTSSIDVQIFAKPTATISSPTSETVCTSSTLFLDVTTDADVQNTTFQWNGPNGFSSSLKNPSIPNVSSLNSGTYSVTVTNENDCTTITSKTITVLSLPSVNISVTPSNREVCMGKSFTIDVTTNAQNQNPTFLWTGPNGFSSTSQTVNLIANSLIQSGIYTVVVTNGVTGCTNNDIDSIHVNSLPTVGLTSTPSNAEVCFGDNVLLCLNTTDADNPTYHWSGPNGYSSTSQCVPFNDPNQSGVYQACVIDGNTQCSSDTINKTVTVHPEIFVDILSVPDNGVACLGDEFTLCASSNASYCYSWSGPNGFVDSSMCISTSLPMSMNAPYQVTVCDSYGCTGSNGISMNIVEVSLSVSTTGNNIEATALGGTSPYTYTISPGGQSNTTGTFSNLQPGTYTVSVSDSDGCGDLESGILIIPDNTVDPVKEWGISISPNPSNGLFAITAKNPITADLVLTLFDGNGTRLRDLTVNGSNQQLDFSDLPAGIYILRVSDERNVGAMRLVILK